MLEKGSYVMAINCDSNGFDVLKLKSIGGNISADLFYFLLSMVL